VPHSSGYLLIRRQVNGEIENLKIRESGRWEILKIPPGKEKRIDCVIAKR